MKLSLSVTLFTPHREPLKKLRVSTSQAETLKAPEVNGSPRETVAELGPELGTGIAALGLFPELNLGGSSKDISPLLYLMLFQ